MNEIYSGILQSHFVLQAWSKSLGTPSPNLRLNNQPSPEAYLRPWKTYMMEFLGENDERLKPVFLQRKPCHICLSGSSIHFSHRWLKALKNMWEGGHL